MTHIHKGDTITSLQDMVARVSAKQALDELGDNASINEASKRQVEIAEKMTADRPVTGGEWFRFLNEGRSDEFDGDAEAEDIE